MVNTGSKFLQDCICEHLLNQPGIVPSHKNAWKLISRELTILLLVFLPILEENVITSLIEVQLESVQVKWFIIPYIWETFGI